MATSTPSHASIPGVPTIAMGTTTPTPALTLMEVDHIITVWGQGLLLTNLMEHLLHACLLVVDWLVICSTTGGWQHGVP